MFFYRNVQQQQMQIEQLDFIREIIHLIATETQNGRPTDDHSILLLMKRRQSKPKYIVFAETGKFAQILFLSNQNISLCIRFIYS